MHGESKAVEGVFELYQDVSPFVSQLRAQPVVGHGLRVRGLYGAVSDAVFWLFAGLQGFSKSRRANQGGAGYTLKSRWTRVRKNLRRANTLA
jgi:hypothetical protein